VGIRRTAALPSSKGTKTLFHYTTDNEVVIERENDVTAILRANHYQRSEQEMRHKSEAVNHVARIDGLAIKKWMAQRGVVKNWWYEFNRGTFLKEFLNDPDNECWRTRKGKI